MKRIRLILLSFSKMKGALFFLIILITLALFVLLYLTGVIRYYGYSIERLEAAELENAVYWKINVDESVYNDGGLMAENSYIKDALDEMSEFPSVNEVITLKQYMGLSFTKELGYEIFPYNDDMLKRFEPPVDGEWLTETYTEDGAIQVVLAGPAFDAYDIGDTIRVNEDHHAIDIYVSGKVPFPWYTLSFRNSSTDILAHYLMVEDNIIIVKDDPSLAKLLDPEGELIFYPETAIVILDEEMTESEQEDVSNMLNAYGSYDTYDEIMANSRDAFRTELTWVLPIPLFLFFSAIGCTFSIASLYVLRNIENQVIFFLCGCSRRRSILLLGQGLIFICLIPALINSAFAVLYPSLKKSELLNLGDVIIDYSAIKIILLFLVIMISLLLLIPIFIYRKHSPQQMYRRLSE